MRILYEILENFIAEGSRNKTGVIKIAPMRQTSTTIALITVLGLRIGQNTAPNALLELRHHYRVYRSYTRPRRCRRPAARPFVRDVQSAVRLSLIHI